MDLTAALLGSQSLVSLLGNGQTDTLSTRNGHPCLVTLVKWTTTQKTSCLNQHQEFIVHRAVDTNKVLVWHHNWTWFFHLLFIYTHIWAFFMQILKVAQSRITHEWLYFESCLQFDTANYQLFCKFKVWIKCMQWRTLDQWEIHQPTIRIYKKRFMFHSPSEVLTEPILYKSKCKQ